MEPAFLLPEIILYAGRQRGREESNCKMAHTDLASCYPEHKGPSIISLGTEGLCDFGSVEPSLRLFPLSSLKLIPLMIPYGDVIK